MSHLKELRSPGINTEVIQGSYLEKICFKTTRETKYDLQICSKQDELSDAIVDQDGLKDNLEGGSYLFAQVA